MRAAILMLIVWTLPGTAIGQPPSPAGASASQGPLSPPGASAGLGSPSLQGAPPATGGSASQGTPSPQRPPAPAPGAPPPAPENYSYDPDGRRDPFQSLLGTGAEPRVGSERPEGPAGISVNELSVRGVMRSRGSLIAMIQGPDNRTYVVHAGDKLLDGVIKAVTPQGLVIVQEVNDPLSLVKQREVTKRLRSLEDAKQ